ncbi:MAG TPA: amidohydrolase family protein [Spirochaetota bacterium]|nr:amidohydrolase family protein [Spirochaetota bacterium]
MVSTKNYQELLDYINQLTIIDTHEHLPVKEENREKDTDILREYLSHYFCRDLISAGLPAKQLDTLRDPRIDLTKRWEIAEPYWEPCRYTGYGRALDITVKKLYGIDKIDGNTITKLNNKFCATLKEGQYQKVLKDLCRIEKSIVTSNEIDYDKDFFRIAPYLDYFIRPDNVQVIKNIKNEFDMSISTFSDWLDACTMTIDKYINHGAAAFKCGLAYRRSLHFKETAGAEADKAFNEILKQQHLPEATPLRVDRKFEDYMFHYILAYLNSKKFTIQIHTGLQEGNGNYITNSDPTLLTNLFLQYPSLYFDIFHISYPFQHLLAALAKNFPNVYIDMCWAHIISPAAARSALYEFLDSVPASKISAFGGDYLFVDAVYGHKQLAAENVAWVLSRKIKEKIFNMDVAKQIAYMLFYDTPAALFRLR